jgi:Ser/Thr protein kinase RdoA (MazF antagonist)
MGKRIMKNIQSLILNWGIGKIEQIVKVNTPGGKVHSINLKNGQKYYLKEKNNNGEIDKELQLYKALSKHGIEISVPLLNLQQQYFVEEDGKLYCLYKALSGRVFNQHFDENALKRAFLYGKSIALLHNGLKDNSLDKLIPEMNLKDQLGNWAIPTILKENNEDNLIVQSIISELNLNLLSIIHTLPIQIIHRDAHPGNIILNDNQIGGFIDFDISRKGMRLFDLCYCSTSILMSDFGDTNSRDMWIKILGELIKGYTRINPISENESRSIVYVIFSIQLIFVAYSYDLGNKDVAKINLEALYWIFKNKQVIQEEISTVT